MFTMPFTVEQKKHIICLFARLDNLTLVRRQYIQDFNITPLESTRLKGHHFSRVWGKIQEDYQALHATSNRKGTEITQDTNAKNRV